MVFFAVSDAAPTIPLPAAAPTRPTPAPTPAAVLPAFLAPDAAALPASAAAEPAAEAAALAASAAASLPCPTLLPMARRGSEGFSLDALFLASTTLRASAPAKVSLSDKSPPL